MSENKNSKLKEFIGVLIELISQGESLSCEQAEKFLAEGIASKLNELYSTLFEENCIQFENLSEIDEYFKNFIGIADGNEIRKYNCKESEGLQLIIKIAINDKL